PVAVSITSDEPADTPPENRIRAPVPTVTISKPAASTGPVMSNCGQESAVPGLLSSMRPVDDGAPKSRAPTLTPAPSEYRGKRRPPMRVGNVVDRADQGP